MAAQKPPPRLMLSWLAYTLLGLFLAWYVFDIGKPAPPRSVAYSEFLDAIDQGRVSEVRLTERELAATLAKPGPGGETRIVTTRLPAIDETQLLARLEKQHVKFSGTMPASATWIYVVM
jgi:ATP-dependent Zn protease